MKFHFILVDMDYMPMMYEIDFCVDMIPSNLMQKVVGCSFHFPWH